MQYNIHINQIKALEWGLIDKEALIIDTITRLPTWAKWKEIDWEIFYYLSAGLLVKQLPWVSLSKWTFLNLIKKLKEKWLLEHIRIWNESYYKLTSKIKEWYISPTEWWDKVPLNDDEGLTDWWDNNNIYYNNNTNTTNNSSKEKKSDLSDVTVDQLISWWNTSLPDELKFPKFKWIEWMKWYEDLKDNWYRNRNQYNKELFNSAMENYIEEIKSRNPKTDYAWHRFTLTQWIKQSNAMLRFSTL